MAGFRNDMKTMAATLEINLTSNESEIRLSFTQLVNDENGEMWNLVVSGEEDRAGFEPKQTERLRSYGNPQRAILILLLRAYGSKFERDSLTSDYSPQLARSLVGILRKQTKCKASGQWLSALVGLKPQGKIADWFTGEGSTTPGRPCTIKLNSKWRSIALVVKVNKSPNPVAVADYEKLAHAIEFGGGFGAPQATIDIDDFKLLLWSAALGCFNRDCDQVSQADRVQLQVRTNQPVHLYALWLDQRGKVVTLYPWSEPDWNWPLREVKVQALTMPDPNRGDPGNTLRIDGPPGVENIIILARKEPISRKEALMFQAVLEGSKLPRQCPRPETVVVSKFDGVPLPTKQLRTIRRPTASLGVKVFQKELAAMFTPHCEQVLICTLTNQGKAG